MSLLLDALQRAAQEKEKLAGERAVAEKLPQPAEPTSSAFAPPLSFDVAPSKPLLSGDVESVVKSTVAAAEELSESAIKPAELTLDPQQQSTAAAPEAISFTSSANAVPDTPFRQAAAEPKTTVKQNPDQARESKAARIEPSLSLQAESEPPIATKSSAPKHPSPVASPQVAREILGATAKTSKLGSNRRLIVLGVLALLVAVANAAFFLGYLNSLLGLPSPGLSPVASVTPMATLPAATDPVASSEGKIPAESPASAEGNPEPAVAVATAAASTTAEAMQPVKPGSESDSPPSQQPKPRAGKVGAVASNSVPSAARAKSTSPVFVAKPAAASILDIAYAALTDGRFEDAVEGYNRVLAKNPGERDALLGLAYIAQRQGQRDEARAYYQQVLRVQPGHPGANAGLLTLAAEGDLQLTASRAREMAERNPESAVALSTLGGLLAREGRIAEAQQVYFKALALEPDNALYAYNLAVALDRLHKYGPAQSYYQRALALAGKSSAGEKSSFPGQAAIQRLEQLQAREPGQDSLSAGNASNNGQR